MQGEIAMIGVFIDTIVICTMTALVLLCVQGTFPNGTEQFKGEFEIGLPIGKHVYKDYNGSTERVERYNLGQREGKWLYYGPNQMLQQTLEYKRGELVRIDGKRIKSDEG